jgi:uncharacterized protein (TIGR02145 family)
MGWILKNSDMKRFIISFVLIFAVYALYAESGTLTVTKVESTPVTGITVITYDLTAQTPDKVSETYNISVEVSFDGGDIYVPVPPEHLRGDVEDVSMGTGKQIIWDGGAGFPNRYSEEAKLKLTASPITSGTFVDDRDGQTYNWVKIGNQVWMAENLKYLPSVTGKDDRSSTLPKYYVVDHDNTNLSEAKASYRYQNYGALYNWTAAINACPSGWHLPSVNEWNALEAHLVSLGYPNNNVANGVANALQSCRRVNSPLGGPCNTADHPRWAEDEVTATKHYGFDEVGFAGHAGGWMEGDGSFYEVGYRAYWWSSIQNQNEPDRAYHWFMTYYEGILWNASTSKQAGQSVRCVKN